MPRLKNAATGVTVQTSDAVAARLSAEWRRVGGGEPQGAPDESWTVKQLKAYAAERDIDLGDATKKVDILDILIEDADESDED